MCTEHVQQRDQYAVAALKIDPGTDCFLVTSVEEENMWGELQTSNFAERKVAAMQAATCSTPEARHDCVELFLP